MSKNNWQVLAMYRNLNDILERAVGGEILLPEQLSKMTALELMELLAPNDVRFCIQKKPKPIQWEDGTVPLGKNKILKIDYLNKEESYHLYFNNQEDFISLKQDEMNTLIAFAQTYGNSE